MRLLKKSCAAVVMALCAFGAVGTASAQSSYPERAIDFVIPFPPGGSSDLIGRLVGEAIGKELNTPVVIINAGGAATATGTLQVVRSAADGYTLLSNSSSLIFNMLLSDSLPYDTFADLAPVAVTAAGAHLLVVSKELPVETYEEFVDYVRAHPDEVTFATSGSGNINHIVAERFLNANGLSAIHVPYSGGNAMYPDLLSGRVDFFFGSVLSSQQFVLDDQLRALAITSADRFSALPEIPSYPEVGMGDYVSSAWQGVMAPAGTPAEVIDRINAAVNAAMQDPDVIEQLARQGFVPMEPLSAAEYGEFLAAEHDAWAKVIADANITQ